MFEARSAAVIARVGPRACRIFTCSDMSDLQLMLDGCHSSDGNGSSGQDSDGLSTNAEVRT